MCHSPDDTKNAVALLPSIVLLTRLLISHYDYQVLCNANDSFEKLFSSDRSAMDLDLVASLVDLVLLLAEIHCQYLFCMYREH